MSFKTTLLLLVLALGLGVWYSLIPANLDETGPTEPMVFSRQFDVARIDRIAIRRRHSNLVLARKDDGTWTITEPARIDADSKAVRKLIEALTRINYSKIPVTSVEADQFGIETPQFTVTVNQDDKSWSVRFADALPLSQNVAARDDAGGPVYAVPERMASQLDLRVMDMADLRLLPINRNRFRRLRLKSPDGSFTIVRTERGYRVQSPESYRGSPRAIDKLLDELADATAMELVFKPFPGHMGLGSPPASVAVEHDDGRLVQLDLGLPVTDRGQLYFARRSGLDDVRFMVRQDLIGKLKRPATAYRARRMMHIEPAQIARLTLSDDRRSVTFRRQDNTWVLGTGDDTEPVDFEAVEAQLMPLITTMVIHDYVTDDASNLAFFGLDKPSRTIEIETIDGGAPVEKLTVQLGKLNPSGKLVYARRTDEPSVVTLEGDLLKVLSTWELAWRSKVVFSALAGDIKSITVVRGGHDETTIERTDGGWRFVGDTERKVDGWKAEEIVVALKRLRADRFVTSDPTERQLGEYGLDTPSRVVRFTVQPPEAKPAEHVLRLGSPDPEHPEQVYARFDDRPYVFTIHRDMAAALSAELARP